MPIKNTRGITVTNRVSITAHAENIPNILKVAEVLETNPNAVMNDCFAGCFAEMERAPGEPISLPSIIKKFRAHRSAGTPTFAAAKQNPLADQIGNLIAILNAEMESLSGGNPPRNPIAVAAINAALAEQSKLLEDTRKDLADQFRQAHAPKAGSEFAYSDVGLLFWFDHPNQVLKFAPPTTDGADPKHDTARAMTLNEVYSDPKNSYFTPDQLSYILEHAADIMPPAAFATLEAQALHGNQSWMELSRARVAATPRTRTSARTR